MDNQIHNLDDGVVEHFKFSIFGHEYKFKQPNTEEVKELQRLKDDTEKGTEFLHTFITKVDKDSPDFKETFKKMTVPHMHKFNEMIAIEMGASSDK